MSEVERIQVMFVGLGNSRVAWYRITLPAMYLGCDWMGLIGAPPQLQFVTGYVQGDTQVGNFDQYNVIVLQQVRGQAWFKLITRLRDAGKVVLYEIDDYVHGIRRLKDHDFSAYFQPEHLQSMELCMRACDGIICSTDYIERRYRRFTRKTWVCENGLDLGRYRLSQPPRGDRDGRETVTLMWSGATGHSRSTQPWLESVQDAMRRHSHVCFASIGQDFAQQLGPEFGDRVLSIPFAALETYPAAMMLGDVALAPAGDTGWYRGKSHLRAMEAAALGLPVVGDRHYEGSVIDGATGFVVDGAGEARERIERLIADPGLRERMGDEARRHAINSFDMKVRREQWRDVICNAWENRDH